MGEESSRTRYTILGRLGKGGMGEVFRARHHALDREVAIKFLPDEVAQSSPDAAARFRREAQACTALSHPNVVKILDVGELDGRPFYVMELVQARDLETRSKKEGPLSPELVLSVLDQVLDALDFCHARGFLHRDLKPANVLLDENGRAILVDFGLVKVPSGTVLTARGYALGTPRFMAPEVVKGEEATARSDLWSLGVTAWELLAGRHLFDADRFGEVVARILREPIPAIGTIRHDLPPTLDAVIDRLLRRDSGERWPDAAAARQALKAGGPAPADHHADRDRTLVDRERSAGRRSRRTRAVPAGRPPRGGPALIIGALVAVLVVAMLAVVVLGARRVEAPGPSAGAAHGPLRHRDLRVSYRALDRIRVDLATDRPERLWAGVTRGRSVPESAPATVHRLEIAVSPLDRHDELLLGRVDDPAPPLVVSPPPSPLELARRLVGSVRAARFTDDRVQAAFSRLGAALSKKRGGVGPTKAAAVAREEPVLAGPIDGLLAELASTPRLKESYTALRPFLGPLLASPAVPAGDRWALVGAVDRLDAADVLAAYVGRAEPFGAFKAMGPAVDGFVAPTSPSAGDRAAGNAPGAGGASFMLYVPGEAPPPSISRYHTLVGESVTSDLGDRLTFRATGETGRGGLAVHLKLSNFHPQMALMIRPPGAPRGVAARRPVATFAAVPPIVWYTLVFRAAMTPPPGEWTVQLARSFLDSARPCVRVDRIIVEPAP